MPSRRAEIADDRGQASRPPRRRRVRSTWVARSPSPSWNQVSPPSALERRHEASRSRRAGPSRVRGRRDRRACRAACRCRARSTSPRCSKSSPVLATTVRSPARAARGQAERELGAADAAGERDDTGLVCAIIGTGPRRRRGRGSRPACAVAGPRRARAPAPPAAPRRPGPSAATPRRRSRRRSRSR